MAARGDTFTIRAYGHSSVGGVIRARAWLEATVERTPYYVDDRSQGITPISGNGPLDALMLVNRANGNYERGKAQTCECEARKKV